MNLQWRHFVSPKLTLLQLSTVTGGIVRTEYPNIYIDMWNKCKCTMYVATLEWKEACSEVNWKNSELIEGMCCFLNIEDGKSLYSTNFVDMETKFLYTWMSTQWLANIIFFMEISNFTEYGILWSMYGYGYQSLPQFLLSLFPATAVSPVLVRSHLIQLSLDPRQTRLSSILDTFIQPL